MNKVLNRTLFTKPKQDHRGTGITSGLQYRQNYRVGGQVKKPKRGLVDGPGGYAGIPVNPNVSTKFTDLDISGLTSLAKNLRSNVYQPDFQQYAVDYTDPKFVADRSALRPTGFDTISKTIASTLDEFNKPTEGRTLGKKSMVNTAVTNFLNASIDDKATRKKLDALDAEDKAKLALRSAEQDSKLGIAGEEAKAVLGAANNELVSNLYMKQIDTLKSSDKWDIAKKMFVAAGIDYDNPETWDDEDLAKVTDITAQFTGEKTQGALDQEALALRNRLRVSAFNSLDDRVKNSILQGNKEAIEAFDRQVDSLLESSLLQPTANTDFSKILETKPLLETKITQSGEKNLLTPLNNLYLKAANDKQLAKTLFAFQSAYDQYLDNIINKEQFLSYIEKINSSLARSQGDSYVPITLD